MVRFPSTFTRHIARNMIAGHHAVPEHKVTLCERSPCATFSQPASIVARNVSRSPRHRKTSGLRLLMGSIAPVAIAVAGGCLASFIGGEGVGLSAVPLLLSLGMCVKIDGVECEEPDRDVEQLMSRLGGIFDDELEFRRNVERIFADEDTVAELLEGELQYKEQVWAEEYANAQEHVMEDVSEGDELGQRLAMNQAEQIGKNGAAVQRNIGDMATFVHHFEGKKYEFEIEVAIFDDTYESGVALRMYRFEVRRFELGLSYQTKWVLDSMELLSEKELTMG